MGQVFAQPVVEEDPDDLNNANRNRFQQNEDVDGNQPQNNNNDNPANPNPNLNTNPDLFTSMMTPSMFETSLRANQPQDYPRLTQAQMRSLLANGLDLGLAFVPYQMPRLAANESHTLERPRVKRTLRLKNTFHLHKQSVQLLPVTPSVTTSSASIERKNSESSSSNSTSTSIDAPQNQHILSFTFDSLAKCRVSIYFYCRDRMDNELSTGINLSSPHPPYSAVFNAGSTLRFELPPDSPFLTGNTQPMRGPNEYPNITSSLSHNVSDLDLCYSKTQSYYPIVIHLENIEKRRGDVDSKELPSRHSFSSSTRRQHDADTPNPMDESSDESISSLLAYCTCARLNNGQVGIRVIRQSIIFRNKPYELQEIYGLNDPSASASSTENSDSSTAGGLSTRESGECVVCLTSARNTIIFPCRHLCLCEECAPLLQTQSNRCPICRCTVETVVRLNLPSTPSVPA